MMLEVEGGTRETCMRILRHEAGHAIDTAYRLRRRKRFRELFGRSSATYPDVYSPRPYSRRYVQHLEGWYAQAHPVEDFAETFAVWLTPGSNWRQRYQNWPAMKKLRFVEEVMEEIRDQRPLVRSRERFHRLSTLATTLGEHYAERQVIYAGETPPEFDQLLRKLFSDEPRYRRNPTAASFLSGIRPEVRRMVSRWTGEYQYTLDQVLKDMILRCRELGLRLTTSERRARQEALVMVAIQTISYLHTGRHRFAL
jgi:Putative zinc-binding metallo-peptidase